MFLDGRLQTGLIFKTKKSPVLFWTYSQRANLSPQYLMSLWDTRNHEKTRGPVARRAGGAKRNPSSLFGQRDEKALDSKRGSRSELFTCTFVSGKEKNGDLRAWVKTLHVFGNDHISVGAGQYADRPRFPEYR